MYVAQNAKGLPRLHLFPRSSTHRYRHSRRRQSRKHGAKLGAGDCGSLGGRIWPNIFRSPLVPRKGNPSEAMGVALLKYSSGKPTGGSDQKTTLVLLCI